MYDMFVLGSLASKVMNLRMSGYQLCNFSIVCLGDIKPSLGSRELATLQNNGLLTARERKVSLYVFTDHQLVLYT